MKITSKKTVHTGIIASLLALLVMGYVVVQNHGSARALGATDFVMTVKTDNMGVSGNNQFAIPTYGNGFNYSVDCDSDGTLEAQNINGAYVCTYATPGTYQLSIKGTFPQIFFNGSTDAKKLVSIDQWGTGAWRSMEHAFHGASNMEMKAQDKPVLTGNNTSLRGMFYGASSMTGLQGNWSWDVSHVSTIGSMFREATAFNGNISSWDTSNITDMANTFRDAKKFNRNLGGWNVSRVTTMGHLFSHATEFNNGGSDAIKNWDVSKVQYIDSMFEWAENFNQPIGNWNTASAIAVRLMLSNAKSFNQSLAGLTMTAVEDAPGNLWDGAENMLDNTAISLDNYDATLRGWAAQGVKPNITVGAQGLKYCKAEAERDSLRTNRGWAFVGDSKDCPAQPPVVPPAPNPPVQPPVAPSTPAVTTETNKTNGDAVLAETGDGVYFAVIIAAVMLTTGGVLLKKCC